MSNLVSFAAKIEASARFIIPVWDESNSHINDIYNVILTRVDESVYMVADNGKTGIESLTSFQANVDAGNYIEVL